MMMIISLLSIIVNTLFFTVLHMSRWRLRWHMDTLVSKVDQKVALVEYRALITSLCLIGLILVT